MQARTDQPLCSCLHACLHRTEILDYVTRVSPITERDAASAPLSWSTVVSPFCRWLGRHRVWSCGPLVGLSWQTTCASGLAAYWPLWSLMCPLSWVARVYGWAGSGDVVLKADILQLHTVETGRRSLARAVRAPLHPLLPRTIIKQMPTHVSARISMHRYECLAVEREKRDGLTAATVALALVRRATAPPGRPI